MNRTLQITEVHEHAIDRSTGAALRNSKQVAELAKQACNEAAADPRPEFPDLKRVDWAAAAKVVDYMIYRASEVERAGGQWSITAAELTCLIAEEMAMLRMGGGSFTRLVVAKMNKGQ